MNTEGTSGGTQRPGPAPCCPGSGWAKWEGAADLRPVEGGPLGRTGGAVAGLQDGWARLRAGVVIQYLLLRSGHAAQTHHRAAAHARITAAAAAGPVPHNPAVGTRGLTACRQGSLTLRTSMASSRQPASSWKRRSPSPHLGQGGPAAQGRRTVCTWLGSIHSDSRRALARPWGAQSPPILGPRASLMAAAPVTRPRPLAGTHSGGQGSVLQARCLLGSLLWALQWWGATAELSS